jgi:hypothetical protein
MSDGLPATARRSEGSPIAREGNAIIQGYEDARGNQATSDRCVGSHHRILYGIRDKQDHHEIEGVICPSCRFPVRRNPISSAA